MPAEPHPGDVPVRVGGHTRLGELPCTRKWQQVVALLAGGAGAEQVANATITAAEKGLNLATEDRGLVETVYLLMQLPLAARAGGDFAVALRNAGLAVPDDPGVMDVVAAFSDAVDRRLGNGDRRDLGEMAQQAACETIAAVVGERSKSLFGLDGEGVRAEFARLGTVAQFGKFCRRFMGRLTQRVLDYFLSRAYRMRCADLEEELVEARDVGDVDRESQALAEMGFLLKQLSNAGWNGRPKRMASDRRNLQASFTMAVARALQEIGRYDRALADHLRPPVLTRGARPMYDPPEPVDWDL